MTTDSKSTTRKGIFLMVCSSICVCAGQLLWKLSATHGWLPLLAGFAFYGIGAIVMVLAYRYGKLSVLQPVLSLNYVLSLVLAGLVLNEVISLTKCLGTVAIIIGLFFIARSE